MLDHDAADDPQASYEHHPVEDIEPQIHSDALRAFRLAKERLDLVLGYIVTSKYPLVAAWQAAFAFGCPHTDGRSQADVAALLGVERATISKGVKDIQDLCGVIPLPGQKSIDACKTYRGTRRAQLKPGDTSK